MSLPEEARLQVDKGTGTVAEVQEREPTIVREYQVVLMLSTESAEMLSSWLKKGIGFVKENSE